MLIDVEKAEVGRVRGMARLGVARMFLAHRAGDDAEVVRAFEATLASVRPIALQGSLIETLAAFAARDVVMNEACRELMERPLPRASLQAMAEAVVSYRFPPIQLTLEVERQLVQDCVERMHTDDGKGNGVLIVHEVEHFGGPPNFFFRKLLRDDPMKGRAFVWYFARHIGFLSKRQTLEHCHRFFDVSRTWLATAPTDRNTTEHPGIVLEEARAKYDLVLGIVVPDFDRLPRVQDRVDTTATGMRTMLALEMFRSDHARYPNALEELVPQYLDTLPVDDFHGTDPLRYRATEQSYLLYSVGIDRTDNGGVHGHDPKDAIDPKKEPGLDLIINHPR